ncbi:uncharacterized protein RHOBADRAFT_55661 [Rhodotorula graminis WP1]|uniref:S1/P1 nuclease n=1 Tax=Rhodotorula graminis (strain WP1) TaxID=578459 RepID=A0A0P9EGX5_RHOGW|nr:uncharacterized protein RHOBADRAFT_55661 [Rhodotorula graminis WP1]KPV72559.1 hypothetical protein RHOBADRAFT_55661 [Rhodotorula graminis WP1]
MLVPTLAATAALFTTSAHAWGAAGHEIVATIAEIHLHPPVLAFLRSDSSLIPDYAKGHLAPIATWPDRIRMVPEYRGWSGQLHYGSWDGDHPPQVCSWPGTGDGTDDEGGKGRWHSDNDVIHAVANYTSRLETNPHDWESLRFLVHFLGDIHQPLHLTSRERGGNGDPVLWEGRRTNLHSLWDGLLIARALREHSNYTSPLPSQQIESALMGRIYDPYIRLLLWEGVRTWWRTSLPGWFTCSPSSSALSPSPTPPHPAQLVLGAGPAKATVCPVTWATETHKTTCEMGFPDGYDEHGAPVEAGGKSEFYRRIRDSLTVERLLTQAGLRLAATLNTVLGPVAAAAADEAGLDGRMHEGVLNLSWLEEAEREAW